MDRHLRPVGDALSRHHRRAAAQRLRPHARRCLPPLGRMALPGFGRGLLAGIDAGLAVRASDRPQSIAGWRPILGQAAVAWLRRDLGVPANADGAGPPSPRAGGAHRLCRRGSGGVGLLARRRRWRAVPGAGGRLLRPGRRQAATTTDGGCAIAGRQGRAGRPAGGGSPAAEGPGGARPPARRERAAPQGRAGGRPAQAGRGGDPAQDRGRDGREERKRSRQEAAAAEKKRQEDEARQKAETGAASLRQAEEANQRAAEAGELGLHLTASDRQRIQVALTALGFDTRGADGVFGALTREMIAAWQKARGAAPTGFVTGEQNQALLKEAAPAISRFDDERRKPNRTAGDESGRAGTSVPPAGPPAASRCRSSCRSSSGPATSSSQPVIVQSEPPAGSLRQGQVILVDDGTCPAGQIKEVTGGRSNERVQRTRRCIPRPRN